MPQNIDNEEKGLGDSPYDPKGTELEIQEYLLDRVQKLKESREDILDGVNYDQIMYDADIEYHPNRLSRKTAKGSHVFATDDSLGLRGSRLVSPDVISSGSDSWQSDLSEPLLLVKIQTAMSILVDQHPTALFSPMSDKYEATTALAKSLWERSWDIANSRKQLKLFVFDLAKYGWAIGHTFPKKVVRKGRVLEEIDADDPQKNKYKDVEIVEYNDVYREKLDPLRTWIDDQANLVDPDAMDDWYYEKDYSWDAFEREFSQYSNNFKSVMKGAAYREGRGSDGNDGDKHNNQRNDIVTVGFYESKNKDLYAIWIPRQDILLFSSPLPNDDKRLSCWHTYWNIRDPRTPYGIGIYELIKNDKVAYDRFQNMSIDQLVMAIYPTLFYTAPTSHSGTGDWEITPNKAKQKAPGTSIEQVKIAYDQRGIDATEYIASRIDDISAITPSLEGDVTGKTLGEVLHAKDAALKRLKIPLGNIAEIIEQDAYLTLSWMNQIYSIPEIKQFSNQEELDAFELETGRNAATVLENNESGEITADFYRELVLNLESQQSGDEDSNLVESPKSSYFKLGIDIPLESVRWEGKVSISARSILAPSPEIDRQRTLEIFNMIQPLIPELTAALQQDPKTAIAMMKPVTRVLKIQDEDPEDWLPDDLIKLANNPEEVEAMQQEKDAQAQQEEEAALAAEGGAPQGGLPPQEQPLFTQGGGTDTLVPRQEVTNPVRESVQNTQV